MRSVKCELMLRCYECSLLWKWTDITHKRRDSLTFTNS